MRKITAITILFAFVASQYARQAAYLECRLTNYFNDRQNQCDCEKAWKGAEPSAPADATAPLRHSHIHIDESFFPATVAMGKPTHSQLLETHTLNRTSVLSAGFLSCPDHPPQLF